MEPRTLLAGNLIRIGALGDSLSDEYQFYAPNRTAALNWVEILATQRASQVTFGAFTTTSRGETRNQGYAQDWARSGATAFGSFDSSYPTFKEEYLGGFTPGSPGLLTGGNAKNLDVVTIDIGGNDYERAVIAGIENNETPQQVLTDLGKVPGQVEAALTSAVASLKAANPKLDIVLVSTPDVSTTPLVQNLAASNEAFAIVANILHALAEGDNMGNLGLTQKEQAFAVQQKIGFVNLDKLLTTFSANPVISGVTLNPNTGGPAYTNLFVGDNFHPGTVGQALLANAIAGQIHVPGHASIAPLSNAQIVQLAQKAQPVTHATLTSTRTYPRPGSPVTFTVSVASFPSFTSPTSNGTYPIPTGTVAFFDSSRGNQLLGIATVNGKGVATFTTSALARGGHNIFAVYNGDGVYPSTAAKPVFVGVLRV